MSHRFISYPAIAIAIVASSGLASAAGTQSREATLDVKSSPLLAVVSINDQKVTIWSENGKVARSSVSSGMSGHRTPTGVFSVIGKERYHESNLYSDAPMPFMQRITWSGIALHAGHLPGYPASHGCIRLPEDFAERLYGMTRTGMRVIVANRDTAPIAIEHPNLPAPSFIRESDVIALATGSHSDAIKPQQRDLAFNGRMQLGALVASTDRLLNPMERGQTERVLVKAAAQQADADARALQEVSDRRAREADAAADAARAADAALVAIQAGRADAIAAAGDATASPDAISRNAAARAALDIALDAAVRRREEARAADAVVSAAAFRAAAETKDAMIERDALAESARVAARATEPVTVFVSRKKSRVYVRQGFEPVFEADVEIENPADPLGTHIYTAMTAAAETGQLKWAAITVPDGASADRPSKVKASRTASFAPVLERTSSSLPPTAHNALSRVNFSEEVMEKISQKLWLGGSLIISDYAPSEETGKGTDFVILTRSNGSDD